ncbi:MAG: hypothetical protein JST80_10745 [Bdellovibrionales bacterium]|nr:hypothetical protein [Bdellovibrionales bacterium]
METQANAMKHRITIFTILLWFFNISGVVQASPVVQFWANRTTSSQGLVFEPVISYYSTSENFDANSAKQPLLNGISASRLYVDLNLNYGLSDSLYLFGRLGLESASVKSNVGNASVFSLGDQLLGASYRLYAKPNGISLSAQLDFNFPAYSNTTQRANGQPYLGDGSTDVTAGGFLEFPLSSSGEWFGELGAAYRYRSNSFSAAVPYTLLLKRDPETEGAIFQAGVRGQFSLNTDNTNPITAIPDQLVGAGGSYIIDAINPSWLMTHVLAGYKTHGGQEFYAYFGLPIAGKNAPSGTQISVGARFDFSPPNEPEETREQRTTVRQDRGRPVTVLKTQTSEVRTTGQFASYNMNAIVTSVNDQLYIAKLDKGLDDGIEKGQIFDIYQSKTDYAGNKKETRVARAKVISVKSSETALSVLEYFVDQWVEIGFTARRLVE